MGAPTLRAFGPPPRRLRRRPVALLPNAGLRPIFLWCRLRRHGPAWRPAVVQRDGTSRTACASPQPSSWPIGWKAPKRKAGEGRHWSPTEAA